jgi:signal transduction histidine kinase/PAS domain-containing protein
MGRSTDTSIRLRQAGSAIGGVPHFRALVEQAGHGILILAEDGSVRYLNGVFKRWAGMEPTARHPDSIAAWLAPGEWETLSTSLSRLPDADHHPTTIPILHFSSPTLGLRLLEGTGTRLPSRSGGSHHVLHLHDVTARIEAENRTRRSEEAARIINSFAGSLVELESEEDVLWNVARDCVGRLGLPDCVVYVLDERRNVLVQRAAWGAKAPFGRQIINPIEIPLGHGIVGAVGKSGRAELVPDTRLAPRYLVDDARRLSELSVPILLSDRVIGVIDVEHPDAGFLDEHHLKILTALAALLANKLVRVRAEEALRTLNSDLERRVHERTAEIQSANARLQEEVAERARAERIQQALYQISEAMHQTHDLPALYRRIHEIICTLMPARNFYIALLDRDSGFLHFPYYVDEIDPAPAPRQGHPGITEYVLRTGRACLANLEEITRLKTAGEYVQSGAPASIWLGVPLVVRGQSIGVMAVQDHHNSSAFGPEDQQILSFIADQTALAIERKRSEQELQRALEQQRELVRLKTNFANLVSHEFRTPIGVVLSSAQVLESYFDRLEPARRTEHLDDIAHAARHMAGLIDEVLLLGRIEAGKLAFQPRAVDLPSFCRRIADEVSQATGNRGWIDIVCPDQLPPAHSDENLLRHVFGNLLSNAIKYSPPKAAVTLTLTCSGRDAVITIRDNGIGIPAEDQPRLFEVFYRGRNVGELPGTGLGLVIVKRCVEVHGGAVSLLSQTGRGTTVIVRLPVFDTPSPTPTHP